MPSSFPKCFAFWMNRQGETGINPLLCLTARLRRVRACTPEARGYPAGKRKKEASGGLAPAARRSARINRGGTLLPRQVEHRLTHGQHARLDGRLSNRAEQVGVRGGLCSYCGS